MRAVNRHIVGNLLAFAHILIIKGRGRDVPHTVICEESGITILRAHTYDAVTIRNARTAPIRLDTRITRIVDLFRGIVDLRQLSRRECRNLALRNDTVCRLRQIAGDVKVVARVVQRIGHARLCAARHVLCIIMSVRLISSNRQIVPNVDRRTVDIHRRTLEIVLERVRRILTVVLELRRTVIDLRRLVKLQSVRNLIRSNRTRQDLPLSAQRVAVHAIVLCVARRVMPCVVCKRRLNAAVRDVLIDNSTIPAADIRIGI